MTAFVLGATGFVGREVVRQLCVRGARTIAHVRPDSAKLADWRARFTELGAEVDTAPWQAGELAAHLQAAAADQLYILIGTTRDRAKTEQLGGDIGRLASSANIYEAIDLGLTAIAVEAARAVPTPPRIVYLSSIGADAGARSAYLRARGKAEAVVSGSGLAWVIARPSIITGERDDSRLGERTAGIVSDGLLAVAGVLGGRKLRDRYRTTSPDILASALIRIGEAAERDRIFDGADLR